MVCGYASQSSNGSDTLSLVDPLVGFAFMQTFIDILREYFGTVSAATLRDNFDVVYQVSTPLEGRSKYSA